MINAVKIVFPPLLLLGIPFGVNKRMSKKVNFLEVNNRKNSFHVQLNVHIIVYDPYNTVEEASVQVSEMRKRVSATLIWIY